MNLRTVSPTIGGFIITPAQPELRVMRKGLGLLLLAAPCFDSVAQGRGQRRRVDNRGLDSTWQHQFASSTNLAHWSFLVNVTNSHGSAEFTDATATNAAKLFNRARRLE